MLSRIFARVSGELGWVSSMVKYVPTRAMMRRSGAPYPGARREPPPRPAYQDSHGHTVDRQGVPSFSQATATGLVVSGVEVVRIMSTLSCRISCRATTEARLGSDWLS